MQLRQPHDEYVKRVKRELADLGYVVLKEKSYRAAQERQRVAEALRAAECARRWARDCLTAERRLRDRLTHVYGVAKAHGATTEDLHGCEQCKSYADAIAEARADLAASAPDPAAGVASTTDGGSRG